MVNEMISRALGQASRLYVRHSPWRRGKNEAQRLFHEHLAWRQHRALVRTKFGDLMALSMPDYISSMIYLTGQWEPVITQYIRSHLKGGDIFVDVGANIGYYSLLASRIVGSTGSVFAIEASKSIYTSMVNNIALNGCTNVTAINAAASNSKGELAIFRGGNNNLGHTTTVEALARREELEFECNVPADTLEQLVGTQMLRNARFIKIDVEGAECAVLSPLFESLNRFSPSTEWLLELSAEFSAGGQADVDRICVAFESAGYRTYAIKNEYDVRFMLDPPRTIELTPLTKSSGRRLCDVLMTRAH